MLLAKRVVIHMHIEDFVSVLLHFDSVIIGIIPLFNIVFAVISICLLPEPPKGPRRGLLSHECACL